MKKYFLMFMLFWIGSTYSAWAQVGENHDTDTEEETEEVAEREDDPEKMSLRDRLYFGGNMGFSFGTVTYIDASPLAGFKITDRFSSGLGITYRYFKDKRYAPALTYDVYGGRVFARYNITQVVYPYAEYEHLQFNVGDNNSFSGSPKSDAFFIGAGFMQPIGQRGGLNVLILYMTNWTRLNPLYSQPWVFRIGFQF